VENYRSLQQGTKHHNSTQTHRAENKALATKYSTAFPFTQNCSTWNNLPRGRKSIGVRGFGSPEDCIPAGMLESKKQWKESRL
jgi:hypothetical protein